MKFLSTGALALTAAFVLAGCAGMQATNPTVSILVDLDPTSTERTLIVENITADRAGMLFTSDRVTGNVLRVDPKSPKPVVVGKVESRTTDGRKVDASPGGIAFDAKGDLYLAAGPFGEVVRIKAAELSAAKPGIAQTFATGMPGASGSISRVRMTIGSTGSAARVNKPLLIA